MNKTLTPLISLMSDIFPMYSADLQITLGIQLHKTTPPLFPLCTNKAEHGTNKDTIK